MKLITEEYRRLNRDMHADRPGFGNAGARWTAITQALCKTYGTTDVLDYGCGKGALNKALPFDIKEYDPVTRPDVPDPADIVICTDVLEHIEPELIRNVVADIAEKTNRAAFLNISLRKANKFLKDGRNAHLIVKPAAWWQQLLEEFFELDVTQVTKTELNVQVRPKN